MKSRVTYVKLWKMHYFLFIDLDVVMVITSCRKPPRPSSGILVLHLASSRRIDLRARPPSAWGSSAPLAPTPRSPTAPRATLGQRHREVLQIASEETNHWCRVARDNITFTPQVNHMFQENPFRFEWFEPPNFVMAQFSTKLGSMAFLPEACYVMKPKLPLTGPV